MYLFMKLSDFLRPSNSKRCWMLKNIKYIIKTLLKTQDNKSLLGQDNIHNIKKSPTGPQGTLPTEAVLNI